MKTILKKAAACFIAVFIAAGFLSVPFPASAQEPVKLTVSSVKGEPGKDVVVSVMVSPNSGIAAMDFILNYDDSKLLYKSYKASNTSEGGLFTLNPNYKNPDGSSALKQGIAHMDGISVEGSIVDITFTVAPGWSGSSAVTLEIIDDVYNVTYQKIPCDVINGNVTIQNTSEDSAETTDSTAPVENKSSPKTLAIVLSVCGVLIIGAAVAFVINRKK